MHIGSEKKTGCSLTSLKNFSDSKRDVFELCAKYRDKKSNRNALVGIVIKDDRIPMKIENTKLSFSGSSSVYRDIYLGK